MPSDRYSLSVCLSCRVCNVGVLWPNGWMNLDETWHADRPRPWLATLCYMGTQLPHPIKGVQLQISIVAKRSPISATAEHLFS